MAHRPWRRGWAVLVLAWVLAGGHPAGARAEEPEACIEDVRFALDELGKTCKHLLDLKEIDWKKVAREFRKDAKRVKTEQEHLVLLVRLVARLEDGHAGVRPQEAGREIHPPDAWTTPKVGPGLFLCETRGHIYVKNAWSAAADVGLRPGFEVLEIEGQPASKWLAARVEEMRDTTGYSTDHQAFASACSWGLGQPTGSRLKVEVRDLEGKKRRRTITYRRASTVPQGPAFLPAGLTQDDDLAYGHTEAGWGYVHLRRCPSDLPERMDRALEALGNPPGVILDFRANGGGGFDHEGFFGRFVPAGKTLRFGKSYESAGPHPYGGPLVVIVDALTRSAGETASGMFKEDGRAYMIGESPTAGMSSSKTTIDLPSGLFSLYVSVASNMGRFNRGRGIEGLGVQPHETVPYDPEDLAAERDTLILRAEALLAEYPRAAVPYDPKDFGWTR